MNILMTTPFFYPSIGGIENHVLNLSKNLVQRGHKVTILTSFLRKNGYAIPGPRETFDVEVERIKTYFLPSWPYASLSSMGFSLDFGRRIIKLIHEKEIDVVHAHGHHYPLSWSAIGTSTKKDVPSVLTFHGMYALDPEKAFARQIESMFNSLILRQMLQKVTAAIALTQTINDFVQKYGPSESKYYVVPNGVDFQSFSESTRHKDKYKAKYGIPEDKTILLFLGRFASVKGLMELAEATKTISRRRKDIFFVFVGNGPLKEDLERKLKEFKSRVAIFDWMHPSKVHELYAASDIFVCPSKWEALPITILEAIASRLYIVATRVGGIPDVLRDYSRKTYIQKVSTENIIAGLETALERYRDQNESCVTADKYDWRTISRNVEQIYYRIERSS